MVYLLLSCHLSFVTLIEGEMVYMIFDDATAMYTTAPSQTRKKGPSGHLPLMILDRFIRGLIPRTSCKFNLSTCQQSDHLIGEIRRSDCRSCWFLVRFYLEILRPIVGLSVFGDSGLISNAHSRSSSHNRPTRIIITQSSITSLFCQILVLNQ